MTRDWRSWGWGRQVQSPPPARASPRLGTGADSVSRQGCAEVGARALRSERPAAVPWPPPVARILALHPTPLVVPDKGGLHPQGYRPSGASVARGGGRYRPAVCCPGPCAPLPWGGGGCALAAASRPHSDPRGAVTFMGGGTVTILLAWIPRSSLLVPGPPTPFPSPSLHLTVLFRGAPVGTGDW